MKKNIILISITVPILIYIAYKLFKKPQSKNLQKSKNIILIGGLDYRKGDKKINEQVDLVKSGINGNYQVQGFTYKDLQGALNALDKTPNSYVLLFSAGCQYAENIAKKIKELNQNLSNLYIAEPFHNGGKTSKSVQNAVNMGVPSKNVFVGKNTGVGLGIVKDASNTPNCSPSHWCALTQVTKIITTKN